MTNLYKVKAKVIVSIPSACEVYVRCDDEQTAHEMAVEKMADEVAEHINESTSFYELECEQVAENHKRYSVTVGAYVPHYTNVLVDARNEEMARSLVAAELQANGLDGRLSSAPLEASGDFDFQDEPYVANVCEIRKVNSDDETVALRERI